MSVSIFNTGRADRGGTIPLSVAGPPNEIRACMIHKGQCHCAAIRIELASAQEPSEQLLGARQCSF